MSWSWFLDYQTKSYLAETLRSSIHLKRIPKMPKTLVIENPEISRNDLVLEDRPGWNVDPVAVVCYDDHRASQAHSPAKSDIAGHSEVVELEHVRNTSKS